MLAKNVTPERARVDIQPRHLRIEMLSPEGEPEYELDLDLAGEVRSPSLVVNARVSCHMQTV